jgi:Tol biopolymer transport system component
MIIETLAFALAIQLSTPAKVGTVDADKLKGEPTRLVWSPDGSRLFLQTAERDKLGMVKSPRSFLVDATTGKIDSAAAEPDWAPAVFAVSSNKFSPWSNDAAITIKEDTRTMSSTSSPMGGSLAKGSADVSGSAGTTIDEVANAKLNSQTLRVVTLSLMGETVGEFVGVQFLPGYTFSWAPKELRAIAYVNRDGRLGVMDSNGKKQQIESTKNVVLPAWSGDGKKIAFLQKAGKNKYDLFVVNVTP